MLDDLLPRLDEPLTVVDVGCRWGFWERWEALGDRVRLIGFEPDAEECRRLEAAYAGAGGPATGGRPAVTVVPAALAATEGTAVLHLTAEPACSSLYPPSEQARATRPALRDVIAPAGRAEVPTTTLDAWAAANGLGRVDHMKLDTQGSELGVLKGAVETLGRTRTLEVEVELNEIYEGQPLFGDVDRFLRAHGFVLWRLGHLVHYGLAEADSRVAVPDRQFFDDRIVEVPAEGGQLYWAHAHYVARDLAYGPAAGGRQAVRDAATAAVLGWADLARAVLRRARFHA